MRAVVQRVTQASVRVGDTLCGEIGRGLLVLLGVEEGDAQADVDYCVSKTVHLRVFEDEAGKMNRSVVDVGGTALVVSQFTLLGDARGGRRPSFIRAARPEQAIPLYEAYCDGLRQAGLPVKTGRFQAEMAVSLVNNGPVTLLLDSRKAF
ncbi:MAG: D-tyrosyl-tRNA(Tyr) deacylase [Oscillospiraceae bacterium]|jgi:D-tyrosyl-tRNA(Tyr) deacylase|nr:D-tyrosyl-tRNA(Tyr) deacylase [Oscillospiraceae bacterium]